MWFLLYRSVSFRVFYNTLFLTFGLQKLKYPAMYQVPSSTYWSYDFNLIFYYNAIGSLFSMLICRCLSHACHTHLYKWAQNVVICQQSEILFTIFIIFFLQSKGSKTLKGTWQQESTFLVLLPIVVIIYMVSEGSKVNLQLYYTFNSVFS